MAGHRRGTGRPTRAALRAQRRRAVLADRMGRAQGPADLVAAAADYARAALAEMEPARARVVAGELVAVLTAVDQR